MSVLAAISPLLLVIALTAAFRRSAFVAAWYGVGLVVLIVLVIPDFAINSIARLEQGLGAAGLITFQAVLVIVPGLYLSEILSAGKTHDQLVDWVKQMPIRSTHKALLIVVGLAPALESLTGFGDSLLVTVPLLMAITTRRTALRQALLSMNIMPWGTLALATVVGAQMSGQSVATLGFGTALISFGVFPAFGAATALMVAERGERLLAVAQGIAVGAVLSTCLVALNWAGVIELAGILAGGLTIAVCLLAFNKGHAITSPPWAAIAPYGIVLGLVFLIRMLPFLGVPVSALTLKAGEVSFAPLGSPGLALVATALILGRGKFTHATFKAVIQRACKPIIALSGFTVMAQLMVISGMLVAVGEVLPTTNIYKLAAITPLLGMVSGYLTGSNVGGNALMMTIQSTIGTGIGEPLAFAAIQNSTAGHAVFASMPIVLLVLAISGGAQKGEEAELVRYGLLMSGLVAAVTVVTSLMFVMVLSYQE